MRHQGRRRSRLLRALDNKEDGASSAFLEGKQYGIFLINLYLIYRIVMKMHLNSIKCLINQTYNIFSHFVYDQLGLNTYSLPPGIMATICIPVESSAIQSCACIPFINTLGR